MAFSVDEFLKIGREIKYGKNEMLLLEGQISNKVYFIKKGVVRHFVIEESGDQKTIRLSKENDFFYSSNVSFFLNVPSYINCQALTDLELVYWESDQMKKIGSENIDFLRFENQKLKEFIIEKHKKEVSRITKSASARLEEFNSTSISLFNRIPHHIIASYLDMTPETLSRLRAKLS